MMVECIACEEFTLRKDRDMAVLGFGNCRHDPDWRYHSAEHRHECRYFVKSDPEAAKARVDWIRKAQGARKEGGSE